MGSLQRNVIGRARQMLAMVGGLAAMVAGAGGHYYADHATAGKRARAWARARGTRKQKPAGSKRMGRGKGWTGTCGAGYMSHFDAVGINWSSKRR